LAQIRAATVKELLPETGWRLPHGTWSDQSRDKQ